MAFFAIAGLQAQATALRSGGQRRLGLPESGPDPTDVDTARAAFVARRRELVPERRLVLAVFMAALEDLRRFPITTKPYAAAWQWLMSDDEGWPLAFRPVCDTLELNADAVRARLRRSLARRSPMPVARTPRPYRMRGGRLPMLLCRAAS